MPFSLVTGVLYTTVSRKSQWRTRQSYTAQFASFSDIYLDLSPAVYDVLTGKIVKRLHGHVSLLRLVVLGAVTLCNFLSNLQRKIEKCFLLQLPRWGVILCNAIWATCKDMSRESLAKLATGAPGSVVGRTCLLLEGRVVTLCNSGCKSRTGFYFVQSSAQQRKMRCKLPSFPFTLRDSSATWCTGSRCKLL